MIIALTKAIMTMVLFERGPHDDDNNDNVFYDDNYDGDEDDDNCD